MRYSKLISFLLFFIGYAKSYAGGFVSDSQISEKTPVATDTEVQGLIQALTGVNPNDTELLKNLGLRVGGAINAGITYNPASPSDRSNYPMTFNDRSNEFMLNRFRLFLQRDVNLTGNDWDIGGRVDFVIGADARYAKAVGLDDKFLQKNRFNQMALPQVYTQIYAPYGNGISVQIGHFFTLLGSSSPIYSVSYNAYSEPSAHTGVLLTTPVNEHWSVSGGAVLGTVNTLDNFGKELDVWNFLGSVTWTQDSTIATVAVVTGDDTSDFDDGLGKQRGNHTQASFVLTHDFAEKWHYKFQHDYGYQAKGLNGKAAHWYGIEQDLGYSISNNFAVGMRAEWFRDQEGLKVMNDGVSATYFGVTAGLSWKPVKWIMFRPEVRYDISSNPVYNDLTARQQFTFASSFTIKF